MFIQVASGPTACINYVMMYQILARMDLYSDSMDKGHSKNAVTKSYV